MEEAEEIQLEFVKKRWETPELVYICATLINTGSISSYFENAPTPFGGTGSGAS